MTDGLKDAHRAAIINLLRANKRVERAVLFGSRAKQTFTPGSDVDIALFGKALTITDQAHLAAAMEELTIPQRVDLLLYHRIEDATLCEHVMQDGIELYRRQESAFDRPLNIPEKYRRVLVSLLQEHLPGVEVWAYGSRVNGCNRDCSDLDLVLRGPKLKEVPAGQLSDFEEALRESTIPFLVEARDWARLPEQFHQEIEQDHLVLVRGDTDCAKFGSTSHTEPVISHSTSDEKAGLLFGNCASLLSESVDPASLSQSIPYIGLEHIAQEKLHLNGTGESTDVTSTKRRFEKGNILFGKLRSYFRKVVQPNFDGICSTDIWVIEPKENVDSRFLFYWCASWDFVNFLDASSEGTRMPRAKWEVAVNHRIPFFSTHEQKAIGHILGTLDNKIELNQKMNQTLEETTKAIFKSWFVDFDPVRAKAQGRPTGLPSEISDLFPSELVDSEIAKIPKEWVVLSLDEMGIFRNGLALQKYPASEDSEPLPVVKIAQLRKGNTKGDNVFASNIPDEFVINDGDFIFSWSGSLLAKYWVGGKGALNQHLFKVEEKMTPLWFVANWVHQHMPEFRSIAQSKATTMGHIKREHLKQAKCVRPPKTLISVAEKVISPLIERGIFAQKESKTLENLRDALLPKLISGELRITDAEKFLEKINI